MVIKNIHEAEKGPVLLCPDIFGDERGYFYESFNDEWFRKNVADITFVQDNQSRSAYGVLRGMHFQRGEHAQAKLVRVVKGAVLDVVLDIREDSPGYGNFYPFYLSEENHYQLFVPRGFAHGFVSLRDDTIFQYKCDNLYNKDSEGSFKYDSFGFDWSRYIDSSHLVISDKDSIAPLFLSASGKEISKKDFLNYVYMQNLGDFEFNNIYAEVSEDGNIVQVQLIGAKRMYDMLSLMGELAIVGKRMDNGKDMYLYEDLNNVIRIYYK